MQLQTGKSHAWMVFLGHQDPMPDKRRIIENTLGGKEPGLPNNDPRTTKDRVEAFCRSEKSKNIRLGITEILQDTIANNSEIIRLLSMRGLTIHPDTGRPICRSLLNKYILYVRTELKIPKITKEHQIAAMMKDNVPRDIIKRTLRTTDGYINELSKLHNIKITKSTTNKRKDK